MSATAALRGIARCDACAQLNRVAAGAGDRGCVRCGAALHVRKPASLARAWAFLVAAAVLYIPANVMPVLHTGTLFNQQTDTILSGVLHLWRTGSWPLAIIVFAASIVVPGAKIASLAVLLAMAQRRSPRGLGWRARLYRVTATIGRWSMVDIFVGATLVALVQFNLVAAIEPGPGAVWFGLVVVLTMLASMSYDPRLAWDARHG